MADLPVLAAKLLCTPLLVAAVTLAGRRFGPAVAGWLAGLPLTSAVVSLFLAVEQGPGFAAAAATTTLLGLVAVVAFCVAAARVAAHATGWGRTWPVPLAAGAAAYAAVAGLLLGSAEAPLPAAFAAAVGAVLLGALAAPRVPAASATGAAGADVMARPPRWDLSVRAATSLAMVLSLTALAPHLGPRVAGVLSPFPVFAAVFAGFTHRQAGPAAAAVLLRGIVVGASAFAVFFLVVGTSLPRLGVAPTYALAAAAALTTNALTLAFVRPRARPRPVALGTTP